MDIKQQIAEIEFDLAMEAFQEAMQRLSDNLKELREAVNEETNF